MALLPHPSAPATVAVLLAAAGTQGDRAFICLRVLAGG